MGKRPKKGKEERIDKLLANTGFWSRKEVRELIKEGRVLIGDEPVLEPEQRVRRENLQSLRVFHDDLRSEDEGLIANLISTGGKLYIALFKPVGYLSTTELEAEYPSFLELLANPLDRDTPRIPEKLLKSLSSAGRLDLDSRGLLIVTNDGQLIHRITHPKWKLPKSYRVKAVKLSRASQGSNLIDQLLRGVDIGGEFLKAEDVKVEEQSEDQVTLQITITHGPYRGIRRALKKLGYKVVDLLRFRIGPLELGDLREGYYRFLRREEVDELRRALKLSS